MEDEKIICLFWSRSEEAISALDQKYGKLCRSLSANILSDPMDAEECVNDAYLGVWNAIPPQRPGSLQLFLCRIVRNLSLRRFRRNRAQKRDCRFPVAYEELQECLPASAPVEEQLEAKELVCLIQRFLDACSREDRCIFLRRYWLAEDYARIARFTGLSEKLISVRLVRLRKKLRQYLTEQEVLE